MYRNIRWRLQNFYIISKHKMIAYTTLYINVFIYNQYDRCDQVSNWFLVKKRNKTIIYLSILILENVFAYDSIHVLRIQTLIVCFRLLFLRKNWANVRMSRFIFLNFFIGLVELKYWIITFFQNWKEKSMSFEFCFWIWMNKDFGWRSKCA